ncbi:MAG: MBL fold metallo-hydrolase [Planctomycetota bacterium]
MKGRIRFLGAARHVTGSKHLLEIAGKKILLDCGLVQGPRKEADRANRELPIAGGDVDHVLLSHAHIDHCGSLPTLVMNGFAGPIHCTEATADMLRLMLLDSAMIQAENARSLARRGIETEPLYGEQDVAAALRLVRPVPYRTRFEVEPGIRAEFLEAGHILGAAIVVVDIGDGASGRRIVFTGDHGRKHLPILRDPNPIPECDVLITESTYGDRLHENPGDIPDQLARIVEEEGEDGGRIVIPAFAVGRSQNLVLHFGRLMESGRIPRLPLFIDSPMSTEATKIMARHRELFDGETRAILAAGESPFFFDGARYVSGVEESKSLNSLRSGVIISASGMCESGRVVHHLRQSVGRKEDCVLIVGFQARNTLGRRLLDGEKRVRILGEEYRVRCRVRFLPGLSAHADYEELLSFERHLAARCRQVFVVHGEEESAETYARRLEDSGFRDVTVPRQGDCAEIR